MFPMGNQLLGESIGLYREYLFFVFFLGPSKQIQVWSQGWDFIPCQDCHGVLGGEYEHGME